MEDAKNTTEGTPSNATRRNFIKGVIAAGAAVSSANYLFRTNALGQGAGAPGSVERLVTLNVNGQERRVDVMKQETLAQTLRYKLGLTGTKLGCDRAECGACTVLVNDVPHEITHRPFRGGGRCIPVRDLSQSLVEFAVCQPL